MKEADVRGGLEWALYRLLEKDRYLLEKDLSERCIAARLAMYLREHFLEYDVDVEYNRQGDAVAAKRLRGLKENCWKRLNRKEDKIAVPDVIVHHRGCNSHNLLVIEMKKTSNRDGTDCDRQRIEAFCEQQHLHYCFGALVECETRTNTPTVRANWYSYQKWTDGFEILTSDDSVEQAEDGRGEQADQRPDHPL